METKKKWTKVGTVLKNKDGPGSYIKIQFAKNKEGVLAQNSVTLKDGQVLKVQDPRKNQFVANDPERLAKIPAYLQFEIFLVE